ncbi:WD40-repeat-containing domain protein [Elsinoe ampelina]|uniref:WD40-repeat-containing domain protein n=1 Tax=Elsinoe ampelina TaxID=302913 RepID=A0A6A6GMM2_9PEZI|nr:WD40-repeat-containing domain protein [Elsinoe ampelina]
MSSQYELSEPPSDVISALKFAPGSSTRLLVSSWDRHIYLYETPSPLESSDSFLEMRIEHRAPVLDICFGADGNTAFSAGLDHDVSHINLDTGRKTVLSTHEKPARHVVYSPEHNILISSGWDNTLHIHIVELENGALTHAPSSVSIPSVPHAISVSPTKLVVAMASRQVYIYDLATLQQLTLQSAPTSDNSTIPLVIEPWQQREPALKYMIRAVACMPNDEGFAISSIEGRVGVEMFDPSEEAQMKKYAFKCHRTSTEEEDVVYPVNALAFHPIKTNVFASAGGDGTVILWDGANKRRIRAFPGLESGVQAMAWAGDGTVAAIGTSPGFEDGTEEIDSKLVKVYIRAVSDSDLKSKGKA